MEVEEKNKSDLKQDKSNNHQNKQDVDVAIEKDKIQDEKNKEKESLESNNKEELNGKKVKELEEKVLRTLAEMENQRRRFEKEREEAFEFGGFAFAKESLALIDNLERAKTSFTNNKKFKENKDLQKILEAFEILEKDLIAIFKRNNIEQIVCLDKKFDPNIKDGKCTTGLAIPKSNWANRIDSPPFSAYAVTCGITFTFGGLKIDHEAQVVDTSGSKMKNLFAAGELIGGLFYFNYPGGSGLTSGAVFGRIAGTSAGKVARLEG